MDLNAPIFNFLPSPFFSSMALPGRCVSARTPHPPHAVARRSAAASLEAVSSTYSSFPAAPLLASSDGICPSLTRAVQQAVD